MAQPKAFSLAWFSHQIRYACATRPRLAIFNAVIQLYGYRPVLGIPIPKTIVIRAFPSRITLAIWVRVGVTGDTHITRLLGMGTPKPQGSWCGQRETNESSSLLFFSLSSPSVFTGYDITFLWQGLTLVSCPWYLGGKESS